MSEYKSCPNGHYYQGDCCPYCKEKEKLKSQLEDLRKDPSSPPPLENAMCYCQMPSGWRGYNDDDDDKGSGLFHKVLIILAIIVAMAIVTAIIYALL